MSGGDSTPGGGDAPLETEILRAKYLDYCSAQIADLLLFLSPDEIYLLAQRAATENANAAGISYVDMVRTATAWLSRNVTLPPFEIWAEDYRAHPDRYEAYFMGLWESDLSPPKDD